VLMSGYFSPTAWKTSMISPSGAIAFATNLPDRVPLCQLVGFVISSSCSSEADLNTVSTIPRVMRIQRACRHWQAHQTRADK
jgi:hypothetical protein